MTVLRIRYRDEPDTTTSVLINGVVVATGLGCEEAGELVGDIRGAVHMARAFGASARRDIEDVLRRHTPGAAAFATAVRS